MTITASNVILIVIFVVCVFVLLWCIKNANNIKLFTKKDKKIETSKN